LHLKQLGGGILSFAERTLDPGWFVDPRGADPFQAKGAFGDVSHGSFRKTIRGNGRRTIGDDSSILVEWLRG
jgi:hypothetical protein